MEENEPLHFPQEMLDMFAEISRQRDEQFRQCKIMLAGFKATGETDLDYMDSYMECLHDFMEQGGDAESLYLDYIDHIATFSPLTAEERKDYLEETLGYKTEIKPISSTVTLTSFRFATNSSHKGVPIVIMCYSENMFKLRHK